MEITYKYDKKTQGMLYDAYRILKEIDRHLLKELNKDPDIPIIPYKGKRELAKLQSAFFGNKQRQLVMEHIAKIHSVSIPKIIMTIDK